MKIKTGLPIIYHKTPKVEICDFCCVANGICGFNAPDMTVGKYDPVKDELDPAWTSLGGWAACETCAQLLEAGELEELARLSLASYNIAHPTEQMTGEPAESFVLLLIEQYKNIIPERVP